MVSIAVAETEFHGERNRNTRQNKMKKTVVGLASRPLRRLVIDTDGGMDDACAIILAMCCPRVRVEAITTCFGNVREPQVFNNVAGLLDRLDEQDGAAERPAIFRGAAEALIARPPLPTWDGHGKDGMGDAGIPRSPEAATAAVDSEPAALALLRLARLHGSPEDPLTVLILGPATNVAMAIRLDGPGFLSRTQLVMMGGASSGKGNASMGAEFNFLSDAEAAHIVMEACGRPASSDASLDASASSSPSSPSSPSSSRGREIRPLVLVPWEACLAGSLSWEKYDALVAGVAGVAGASAGAGPRQQPSATPPSAAAAAATTITTTTSRGRILQLLSGHYEAKVRHQPPEEDGSNAFLPCDAYAACVALAEMLGAGPGDMIAKERRLTGTVELSGGPARGASMFDWYGGGSGDGSNGGNVRLVERLNQGAFEAWMGHVFGGGPAPELWQESSEGERKEDEEEGEEGEEGGGAGAAAATP